MSEKDGGDLASGISHSPQISGSIGAGIDDKKLVACHDRHAGA